jgi:hypothetical protein
MSGRQGLLKKRSLFFQRYGVDITGRLGLFAATYVKSPLRHNRSGLWKERPCSLNQLQSRVDGLFVKPLSGSLRARTVRLYKFQSILPESYARFIKK